MSSAQGHGIMPINRLLIESKLSAQDVKRLNEAFELTLRGLHLVDRNDPICELVARRIIDIGTDMTRDPKQIAALAVKQLGT
jgi:hypothetical protein